MAQFAADAPVLCLIISGGHTQMVLAQIFHRNSHKLSIGKYKIIGQTRDDAAGEAFDKVARMLNLGYPGGEIIETLAKQGDPNTFNFPIPMARDPSLDFSFSGLKTAVMYTLKKIKKNYTAREIRTGRSSILDKQTICDIAASFQKVLIRSITLKLNKAIQQTHPSAVWLGGGVGANLQLRKNIRQICQQHHLTLHIPYSSKFFGDNAAMIGLAAYFRAQRSSDVITSRRLDRKPHWNLE